MIIMLNIEVTKDKDNKYIEDEAYCLKVIIKFQRCRHTIWNGKHW